LADEKCRDDGVDAGVRGGTRRDSQDTGASHSRNSNMALHVADNNSYSALLLARIGTHQCGTYAVQEWRRFLHRLELALFCGARESADLNLVMKIIIFRNEAFNYSTFKSNQLCPFGANDYFELEILEIQEF